MESEQKHEEVITVVEVYGFAYPTKWVMFIPSANVTMEGDRTEEDPLRHEIQSLLEMLVILRSFGKDTYKIYMNSNYCRNLVEKWIPKWVEQRFRIPNKEVLRPNHDLIVKLYSFQLCMKFELSRHYDDFVYYNKINEMVSVA